MPARNPDTTYTQCMGENCEEKVANHSWGRIKATGWFFSKDGKQAYCPDHLPDWVVKWRKGKARASSE